MWWALSVCNTSLQLSEVFLIAFMLVTYTTTLPFLPSSSSGHSSYKIRQNWCTELNSFMQLCTKHLFVGIKSPLHTESHFCELLQSKRRLPPLAPLPNRRKNLLYVSFHAQHGPGRCAHYRPPCSSHFFHPLLATMSNTTSSPLPLAQLTDRINCVNIVKIMITKSQTITENR